MPGIVIFKMYLFKNTHQLMQYFVCIICLICMSVSESPSFIRGSVFVMILCVCFSSARHSIQCQCLCVCVYVCVCEHAYMHVCISLWVLLFNEKFVADATCETSAQGSFGSGCNSKTDFKQHKKVMTQNAVTLTCCQTCFHIVIQYILVLI